jgi:hypothetical protein
MTRALLIGEKERTAIKDAIARAATHPITLEMVKAMHVDADRRLTLAMRREQQGPDWERKQPYSEHVELPIGIRAAISFEEQPIGMCRHLSVSVDKPGALPNPAIVESLMKEFGCEHVVGEPWIEEFEPGHEAVNIVALSALIEGTA